MNQNALQEESKDLETLGTQIIHHTVHDRSSFIDSWEFIMLIAIASIIFGFILGLGLRMLI